MHLKARGPPENPWDLKRGWLIRIEVKKFTGRLFESLTTLRSQSMVVSWKCLKTNARPCQCLAWCPRDRRKPSQPVGNSNKPQLVGWQTCPQPNSDLFQGVRTELVQTDQIQHECLSTKLLTWSIFKFSKKISPDINPTFKDDPILRPHTRGWYDATTRLCSRASKNRIFKADLGKQWMWRHGWPWKPGRTRNFIQHLEQGFIHMPGGAGFLPSTVLLAFKFWWISLLEKDEQSLACSLDLVVWDPRNFEWE